MNILKADSLSNNVVTTRSNYGNERITRIRLGRVLLSSVTLFLLNIVSLGDFNKKTKGNLI